VFCILPSSYESLVLHGSMVQYPLLIQKNGQPFIAAKEGVHHRTQSDMVNRFVLCSVEHETGGGATITDVVRTDFYI
jgi:hypothetical protein